jgi:hypothetical protein
MVLLQAVVAAILQGFAAANSAISARTTGEYRIKKEPRLLLREFGERHDEIQVEFSTGARRATMAALK